MKWFVLLILLGLGFYYFAPPLNLSFNNLSKPPVIDPADAPKPPPKPKPKPVVVAPNPADNSPFGNHSLNSPSLDLTAPSNSSPTAPKDSSSSTKLDSLVNDPQNK